MDYKLAYEKTVEQLFLTQQQLITHENEKELTYKILCNQSEVIGEIWAGLEKATGERREKAELMLQKLILVFNHMGRVYLNELAARKRNLELNKALLDAAEKIKELEKKLKTISIMEGVCFE